MSEFCFSLSKCFESIGAFKELHVATGVIDAFALRYVQQFAADIRVLVADLGPIPRTVFNNWRDIVKVLSGLHSKLYLTEKKAIIGSANLTLGGLFRNEELNIIISEERTVRRLHDYFNRLWDEARDLTEDLVEDIDEPSVGSTRLAPIEKVNRLLTKMLGVDARCLTTFNPGECARKMANAIREGAKSIQCNDIEENCIAGKVHKHVKPVDIIKGADSAVVAGHPLCWVKSLISAIKNRYINVKGLDSGMKIYEAMVHMGSNMCSGIAKRLAHEELNKLSREQYRDGYVRWPISYRLLPLALTLPSIGCMIEGRIREDGRKIRRLKCVTQ